MSENNFYNPEEARKRYGDVVPVYQEAYYNDPWYERSKCADRRQRCVGGLSSTAVGSVCNTCFEKPTRPAYETDELVERFNEIVATRPSAWYMEDVDGKLAFATLAWKGNASLIARDRYKDVPEMSEWLAEQLGDQDVIWLDEVFADKRVRESGNLANFTSMCDGFRQRLGGDVIAFRTINERLLSSAQKQLFGQATIFGQDKKDSPPVPDRRKFVLIKVDEQ